MSDNRTLAALVAVATIGAALLARSGRNVPGGTVGVEFVDTTSDWLTQAFADISAAFNIPSPIQMSPLATPETPTPGMRSVYDLYPSSAIVEFVARKEGFRATPSRDPVGNWEIGYGHFLGTPDQPKPAVGPWSKAQALDDLTDRLWKTGSEIKRYVRVALTQPQFDALVSWTDNLGIGALAGSTLLKRLNAADYQGAAAEMLRWVHATQPDGTKVVLPGLQVRRAEEHNMFVHGVYP